MNTAIDHRNHVQSWLETIREQLERKQLDNPSKVGNPPPCKIPRLDPLPLGSIDPEMQQTLLETLKTLDALPDAHDLDHHTAWSLAPYVASENKEISALACRVLRERHSIMPCRNQEKEEFNLSPVLLALKTRIFPPEMGETLMQISDQTCPIGATRRGFQLLQKLWEGTPLEELLAEDSDGKALSELYQAADYCDCLEMIDVDRLVNAIIKTHCINTSLCLETDGTVVLKSNLSSLEEVKEIQKICRLLASCDIASWCLLSAGGPNFKENLKALLNPSQDNHVSRVEIRGKLDSSGAIALAEALKQNQALQELNLEDNWIGDQGATAIAEALKQNQALQKLNLRFNFIGAQGATAIAEALKQNQALQKLHLRYNSIGVKGATALADALKQNQALQELYLGCNSIGDQGATAIAEALKQNQALQKLDLGGTWIGAEGRTALRTLQQLKPHLKILR